MSLYSSVSIHPYFQPHEGQMAAFKEMLPAFLEATRDEEGCLFYEFTICENTVFCREAYTDGDAALVHLGNVDDLLKKGLGISDLVRLEIHGPAAELDKLREPLNDLPVDWFVLECGLEKQV